MENRSSSLTFKLFYFVFIGAVGAFTPYINVYLEQSQGLSGSEIGLINALGLIIGVCVLPIWGVIGDKTKKYNILLRILFAGTLVMVALYYKAATYPTILTCAIGLETLRLGTTPIADTITTDFCHKTGNNYGSIRAMGSLGYMLSGIFIGFIADYFGLDGSMFATYATLLVLALGITFKFPKSSTNDHVTEEEKVQKGSFKKLLTNKHFIFILFFAIFSGTVADSAMTYGGNHLITTLGGAASSVSYMTFVTVLPEVVFLMVARKVIDKLGFKKFYLLSLVLMIFRFGVYALTSNMYIFLLVSTVHCFGVAVTTVGNLTYIRSSVNPAVLGTAITLLNVSITISRALFGYTFGLIYEYGSSYMIFLIAAIIFIAMFFFTLRTKHFDHLHT
jgi:oligosaccharide:H+ symporter